MQNYIDPIAVMIDSLKEDMKTKNIKKRREEILRFMNDRKY